MEDPGNLQNKYENKKASSKYKSWYWLWKDQTNALGANNAGEVYVKKPASTGFGLPLLMQLKIIDEDGNDLNTNETGEVCIKSASTFRLLEK